MKGNLTTKTVFFALMIVAASPAAARKTKNFRKAWKNLVPTTAAPASRAAATQAEIETSTTAAIAEAEAVAAGKGAARVMPGRWTADVRAALDEFLAKRGKKSPTYNEERPPVAVLPWSDALVVGDPAELVFTRLTSQVDFKFDEEWWKLVPLGHGRQPARAAYEGFISFASSTWMAQPDYHLYRKTVLAGYLGLCRKVGRRECRQYLMRLWAGWNEDEAYEYTRMALAEEKARATGSETIAVDATDKEPLTVRRGLRLIPEMRDLAVKLRAAGVDVWVVDDVPQPVLAASAADYGIDDTRIAGIKAGAEGVRYTGAVLKPVPTRGGKAEILKAAIGRGPDLVIGRDHADLELMNYGKGVRIVLTGDPVLEAKAREQGWLVQPSLAR